MTAFPQAVTDSFALANVNVEDIAVDSLDNFVESHPDNGRIYVHSGLTNTVTYSFAFSAPRGIDVDADNNLLISDGFGTTIRHMDGLTGTVVNSFAGPATGVGLAIRNKRLMRYCKVEIHKTRDDTTTCFAYPEEYDPHDHECLAYQNEGGSSEHVITVVPDDFDFWPAGFEELSPVDAAALIGGYIDADKDMPEEARAEFKTRKLDLAAQAVEPQ